MHSKDLFVHVRLQSKALMAFGSALHRVAKGDQVQEGLQSEALHCGLAFGHQVDLYMHLQPKGVQIGNLMANKCNTFGDYDLQEDLYHMHQR